MNEAIKVYLQDVLGVEWVPRRAPGELHQVDIRSAPKGVTVVTPESLSAPESELLGKMMASIQVHEYSVFTSEEADAVRFENGLVLLGISASNFRMSSSSPVVELPSIAALMDESDPAQLQQTKRQAWMLLQRFKKELKL